MSHHFQSLVKFCKSWAGYYRVNINTLLRINVGQSFKVIARVSAMKTKCIKKIFSSRLIKRKEKKVLENLMSKEKSVRKFLRSLLFPLLNEINLLFTANILPCNKTTLNSRKQHFNHQKISLFRDYNACTKVHSKCYNFMELSCIKTLASMVRC